MNGQDNFLKKYKIYTLISLAVVIAIWEIIAIFIVSNSFILPSFTGTIRSLYNLVASMEIFGDLAISLYHFAIGMFFAIILGIPIGMGMGWFKKVNYLLDPLIELLRPIPPLAWIPFAIVWFGLTHQSAGFIIFIGAFFPILTNTYSGFSSVPKTLVEAAMVLGCTKNKDLLKSVGLPSSFPDIAVGLRVAMGIGWMCLVAAELFGVSKEGLGYKIWWYYYLHRMDNDLSYMIALGLIGLGINWGFRFIVEKKLLKWMEGTVY
jgi:NitT/TauT family transport system permease protein